MCLNIERKVLTSDTSQGIASVTYNHLGQPLTVTLSDKSQVLYSYSYDGRLQQIEYGERSGTASVGFTRVKNRRYYDGNFIFEDDSLSMANFPGGYFDGKGQPYYRHSDWQGSVAMVTNGNGSLVQHNGYYPYGEPWRVVEGQPYLYGGKERLTNNDNIEYDFGARRYHSASALWSTPDPAAIKFPAQNPYVFCAANPIKYVDPTGEVLVYTNATREDLDLIVEIFTRAVNGLAEVSASDDGYISIVRNEELISKSDDMQALTAVKGLTTMVEDEGITEIIIKNNSEIKIGDAKSRTIDLGDISKLGTEGAVTSAGALYHESIEQYCLQTKNRNPYNKKDMDYAHTAATSLESKISGVSISPVREIFGDEMRVEYNLNIFVQNKYDRLEIIYFDPFGNVKYKRRK